jgi:hypothetical protein
MATTRSTCAWAALVTMGLHRGDGSLGVVLGVHAGLAMTSIAMCGSEEQKARWLPEMARMDSLGAFALTEPDHGSDSVALETSARRDGDDWVLNGRKRWIGLGTVADLIVVWARSSEDGQVGAFVVEKGSPGYQAQVIDGEGVAARRCGDPGTMQPGQLIGAGCGEHVPGPAGKLGDRGIIQPEGGDQLRVVAGEFSGVLVSDDHGRAGSPQQVVLGVLDDGRNSPLLGRSRGGQVVVALDLRAVVGVDSRPPAPGPGALVAHGLVGGADPGPVDLKRAAVVADDAVPQYPALDDRPVDRPGGQRGPGGPAGTQP